MKKLIVVLAVFALLAGCAQQQSSYRQAAEEGTQTSSWKLGNTLDYTPKTDQQVLFTLRVVGIDGNVIVDKKMAAEKGQNLFMALSEGEDGVTIGYEEYPFGVFIYQVAGIEPPQGEYLAIYINGKYSEKGAQDIIPLEGQTIDFRVEKIK